MTGMTKIGAGLFALCAAILALVRQMPDEEYQRLTRLKRFFGRKAGISCYFITDVALPGVIGLATLSKGVAESGMMMMVP